MTVVKIPDDGASKRFKASQENAMMEKTPLVEKKHNLIESLRKKLQAGEALDAMSQSNGWGIVKEWCNTTWSFELIMNEMQNNKTDPEHYKTMMIQRQAIESLFKFVARGIQVGKEARLQLAEEEKPKPVK